MERTKLSLKCEHCGHEFDEFMELPMIADGAIARFRGMLTCPSCGKGGIVLVKEQKVDIVEKEMGDSGIDIGNGYGKRLKVRRVTRGFTLKQLSQASGVSTSHLGRIESGKRYPGGRIIAKIEKALGGK